MGEPLDHLRGPILPPSLLPFAPPPDDTDDADIVDIRVGSADDAEDTLKVSGDEEENDGDENPNESCKCG